MNLDRLEVSSALADYLKPDILLREINNGSNEYCRHLRHVWLITNPHSLSIKYRDRSIIIYPLGTLHTKWAKWLR